MRYGVNRLLLRTCYSTGFGDLERVAGLRLSVERALIGAGLFSSDLEVQRSEVIRGEERLKVGSLALSVLARDIVFCESHVLE